MKKHFVFVLLATLGLAVAAYGVPSFTPTIDGVKDVGWGSTPDHSSTTSMLPTSFNLDGGCYVTDDSANVYIGIPTDPDANSNGCAMHVLIDLRNTPSGANTEAYGACAVGYDMPYLAEYDIAPEWSTGAITYANKCTWTGSGWTYTPIHGTGKIAGGANLFTEIKLSRTEYSGLGQNDTINISIWLRFDHWYNGGSNNANACLPEDADFPTDSGYAPCDPNHNFSTQFFYKIQTALVDTTKPWVVSATQAGANKVIVEFNEYMNTNTLVYTNFSITGGLNFTASQVLSGTSVLLTASPDFAAQQYTITANSNVKDVIGNPIDPAHNSAFLTAVLYSLETFVYVDQNGDLTAPHAKGSFNNYGNYDPNWGVTPFPMYDDGTHGDTTSGDDRWTAQFYLKPSATDTFGWGVTEGLYGPWAFDCGDKKFTVPNYNPQTQLYVAPVYAPVTFRVDDSQVQTLADCWVKGTFNSIGRYEGAWGDYHQAFDDGLHNDLLSGDNIWGVVINLIPDNYCHDSTWQWGAADAYNGNWIIEGPNRQFAVPTSAARIETYVVIPHTVQDVTVTFNVNCKYLLQVAGVDSMALTGDFNGWNATAHIMSDANNDSIYTVAVLFDSGSAKYHEFKFVRWFAGAAEWESINNRNFLIDDSGPTQTIDCIWNDWIPAPDPPRFVTLYRYDTEVNQGLMLRWLPAETGTEPAGFMVYAGPYLGTMTPKAFVPYAGPAANMTLWKAMLDLAPSTGATCVQVNAVAQPFPPGPAHDVTFPTLPDTVYVNRGDWVCFGNQSSFTVDGKLNPLDSSPWECGNKDFYLSVGPPYIRVCWQIDDNAALGSYRYGIYYNGTLTSTLVITVQ